MSEILDPPERTERLINGGDRPKNLAQRGEQQEHEDDKRDQFGDGYDAGRNPVTTKTEHHQERQLQRDKRHRNNQRAQFRNL